MYSFVTIENGIKYTVYYFATFTGTTHPFTPTDPLNFEEIHAALDKHYAGQYYQGWYSDTKNGQRLDKLLKIRLMKEKIELGQTMHNRSGIYYNNIIKEKGNWTIGVPISPESVLKENHYIRYILNKDGKIESAYRVFSMVFNSYIYTYSKDGLLENVDMSIQDIPEKIPN